MSKTIHIVNTPLAGDFIIKKNGSATERFQAFLDEIERFGTVEDVWDDRRFPSIANRLDSASTRYDYDLTDLGVNFHSDARNPNEMLGNVAQMPLAWREGSIVRPRLHWLQNQAAVPNWLMEYRIYNNGVLVPAVFTSVITGTIAFTYPGSGMITQISSFPEIDMTGLTLLSFIDCKIYRDTGNTSGLFAGADPVATDVTLKEFDIRYQLDGRGSLQEFIK